MMEPIYAKCNKSCGHKFYVQHFKKVKLQQAIEKTYFSCPNCGREYVCFYTDEYIRYQQARIRDVFRQMKWAGNNELERLKQEEFILKEDIIHSMSKVRRLIEV